MRRNVVVEIGVGNDESPVPGGAQAVARLLPPLGGRRPRHRTRWSSAAARAVLPSRPVVGRGPGRGRRRPRRAARRRHRRRFARRRAPVDELPVPLPALSPGGWYVLGDISTSCWPGFRGMVPADSTTGVGLLAALVSDCPVDDPIQRRPPRLGAATRRARAARRGGGARAPRNRIHPQGRPPLTTARGTAHEDVCVGSRGRATGGRHVPR